MGWCPLKKRPKRETASSPIVIARHPIHLGPAMSIRDFSEVLRSGIGSFAKAAAGVQYLISVFFPSFL
jgi:hypothetical protein